MPDPMQIVDFWGDVLIDGKPGFIDGWGEI
jgi:hypothetical protein